MPLTTAMLISPLLAAVGLLYPAMLGGLLLVSLPIIAHLLNRKAKQTIIFPSLMLLRETRANQSQLFKLRRWILLALRCLGLALIVLAFAQPLWTRAGGIPAGQTEQAAGLVVVFDRSASSASRLDGVRVIDSLRAEAGQALDGVESGLDYVNVIFADHNPTAALPRMSRNLHAVRQAIENTEPTIESPNLSEAIARAGEMLAQVDGSRHLVIVSDLQAENWRPVLSRAVVWGSLPANTRIRVLGHASQ